MTEKKEKRQPRMSREKYYSEIKKRSKVECDRVQDLNAERYCSLIF